MGEAKQGKAFIQHEFDEAISIQQAIVDAGQVLAKVHPLPEAKTAIAELGKVSQRQLKDLQRFGKPFGATGKAEDVAKAMKDLAEKVAESAESEPSEAYEAHAVLLTLLRKQQDSAGAVAKIAQETGNQELKTAATEMQRETKSGADELAKLLATFAAKIATGKAPAQA